MSEHMKSTLENLDTLGYDMENVCVAPTAKAAYDLWLLGTIWRHPNLHGQGWTTGDMMNRLGLLTRTGGGASIQKIATKGKELLDDVIIMGARG